MGLWSYVCLLQTTCNFDHMTPNVTLHKQMVMALDSGKLDKTCIVF